MDYFTRPATSASGNAPASTPRLAQTPSGNIPTTPLGYPLREADTVSSASPRARGAAPVRIRRLPSSSYINVNGNGATSSNALRDDTEAGGRRRSSSEPQRPNVAAFGRMPTRRQQPTQAVPMATLTEEGSHNQNTQNMDGLQSPPRNRESRASDAASTAAEWVLNRPRRSSSTSRPYQQSRDYERDVVDVLDVIDPEVSALTTFNNVQNSLFIPNLGRFLNRQPTYDLSQRQTAITPQPTKVSTVEEAPEPEPELDLKKTKTADGESIFGQPLEHSHSISSVLSYSRYAVLPHGVVLEGWSDEDKDELNDHVRHLLHSRKAKFSRSMRAFGKYVRTPLGAFVTIYSFLITFWGAAWVLFIIGWLSVSGRQKYFIEICDQVLTALFCVVGIGLSPFRAIDTYHMIYIAKYHYKTLRLRRERGLPPIQDMNDLPEVSADGDVEAHPAEPEDAVLPEEQQKIFHKHQAKFCKSHTFYKPHETFTHNAFPLALMIQVVVLLDCHSLFQMALGGTTWGIYYRRRPKALTAVILTCSICCNIAGGLTIKIGDGKTRKKEIVERLFRQALTEEALHKMDKQKGLHATSDVDALESKGMGKREGGGDVGAGAVRGEKHPSMVQRGEAQKAVDAQNATNADVVGTFVTT